MTAERVELGRYRLYDTRMSVNGTQSWAICHKQELAFTGGRAVAVGATGEKHPRGSMSLVNVSYTRSLTWSNPNLTHLEQQVLVPMFGEHPLELGLRRDGEYFPLLRTEPRYRDLFPRAFPGEGEAYSVTNMTKAIASFERIIISANTLWDRYHYGRNESALSDAAKHGEVLSFSQPLSCFRCHGGRNFSENRASQNSGLYNPYAAPNVGLFEFTHKSEDLGKFKPPTLRNIAVTGPDMHDRSIPTLDGVLDHDAGEGGAHHDPQKDPLIRGFKLPATDRQDLIEFLKVLTDANVLHAQRFSNPWLQ